MTTTPTPIPETGPVPDAIPPLQTYQMEIEVRPEDCVGRHVNNARYFAFIGQTLQGWYVEMSIGPTRYPGSGIPMAHMSYDFKREVMYPGKVLCVIKVARVGRTSLEHAIEIYDITNGRELAGRGRCVHVWMNRIIEQAESWPAHVLAKCWNGPVGQPPAK